MSNPRDALNPHLKARARELRRDATRPEQMLWSILRNRRLGGLKFRRQHPTRPFVVDFCCHEIKLLVELDGMSHVGRAEQDESRTTKLEWDGWKVVRVTNDDVLQSIEAVARTIARETGLKW